MPFKLIDSAKDKQVNNKKTGGSSKATYSVLEAPHGLFCFGHVVRRNKENLEKNILFGKVSSSRGRRRSLT